jgi:lipopolysaccharide transport system permease protein
MSTHYAPPQGSGRDQTTGADVTIVRPRAGWVALNLPELWHYRELLYFLVWRNIKVRYKQTLLGASWALIQPLATMVVFSIFFGRLAKVPSDGVPYPLFAYCGLLPWQLFSYAMTEASNSVVGNQQLITKVYFPRLVVPISAVISGLVDFTISFSLLLLMMPFYGVMPTVRILVLPLFILFAIATALAIGLWLSALNVEYRDVRYTIPFLTQFWLLITPVAYPSSLVPAKWRALMGLNPMAGVVEGFRWALLGNSSSGSGALMMVSVVIVIALLFGGIVYFRRMETTFADLV